MSNLAQDAEQHSVSRWRFLISKNLLVLLSQAFVSGTNFATAMIVGNSCGADGLGYYALGFSILVFGNGFQSALVSIPYTVFYLSHTEAKREQRLNNSLITHVGLLLSLSGIIGFAGLLMFVFEMQTESSIAFGLLFATPCFVTREFARRICFADEDYFNALNIDFVTSVVQLSGLSVAAWFGCLSPGLALACIGFGCLCGTIGFFGKLFRRFSCSVQNVIADAKRDWEFGKWLLLEQLFTIASSYSMPWLLAFYLDSVSVGIFAACFTIAGLSNPFLQAIGSYSLPTFARLVTAQDRFALSSEIRSITMFTVGVMSVFFVVCLTCGELFLRILFRNPEFAGHGIIVGILAVRAVLGSLGLTAHYYLLAIEKPKTSLLASVASIAVMVIAGMVLIPGYGLVGAAIAWAAGTLVESLVMLVGYFFARIHLEGLGGVHA